MSPAAGTAGARVSVIVVSWCRPMYVRSCLNHLIKVETPPSEVVVVDASPDDLTRAVVAEFPGVTWIPFPDGARHMTTSRNAGLRHVCGDVIAFLDDDCNVHPGWLTGLVDAYRDPAVSAVAGRTCNGTPGEELDGVDCIGRLLPSGQLTGNFGANPGKVVEIDHGIGANMSFRTDVLEQLGGFRDDFAGVGGIREDTDVFLRTKALGYRADSLRWPPSIILVPRTSKGDGSTSATCFTPGGITLCSSAGTSASVLQCSGGGRVTRRAA